MENNNEIKDEEIITTELGQEESAGETPTEAPEENPTVEPESDVSGTVAENDGESKDSVVGDDKKEDTEADSSSADTDSKAVDTTTSDEPSPEKEEGKEEKGEDNPDNTPSPEPSEEPTEVPADKDKEVDEESQPNVNEELEKARRELAEIREQEETRKAIEDINIKAVQAENQIADFDDKLQKALVDTFKQYEIDINTTMDELKSSDPAKFAIAQELLGHAEHIRAEHIAQIQAPVAEAQRNLVFKEASKLMSNYAMTDDEASVAAQTLINIFNTAGLNDLDTDLKAKVELAVAHAKFTAPKEEVKKVEEVKQEEEPKKEQDSQVATEGTEPPKEEAKEEPVVEEPTEAPTEKPEPKADINAFKESVSVSDAIVNNREGVTVDNVLQKLMALNGNTKARNAFTSKYQDLIDQACIGIYKRNGYR